MNAWNNHPFEAWQVMPLFSVARAALNCAHRNKDDDTLEGLSLLMDVIEERVKKMEPVPAQAAQPEKSEAPRLRMLKKARAAQQG